MIDAVSRPAISGSISRPEPVGDAPSTTWRNSGRKVSAPNIASPTRNETPLVTLNGPERNRLRGITGSCARRSWRTKSTSINAPATPKPMITPEFQAYWVPPQVVSRISAVAPPASNAAPR